MATVQNPHDKLFRETYSQKENAQSFLEHSVPPDILQHMDLHSLEICKDSFIDEQLKEYYSDLLYTVTLHGQPGYVYVLFEHKSYPDRLIHLQLLEFRQHCPNILMLMRELVSQESGLRSIETLLRYICSATDTLTAEEFLTMATQALDRQGGDMLMTIAEQLRTEGRQEGWQEGRQEGFEKGTIIGEILFAQKIMHLVLYDKEELEQKSLDELNSLLAKMEAHIKTRHEKTDVSPTRV